MRWNAKLFLTIPTSLFPAPAIMIFDKTFPIAEFSFSSPDSAIPSYKSFTAVLAFENSFHKTRLLRVFTMAVE